MLFKIKSDLFIIILYSMNVLVNFLVNFSPKNKILAIFDLPIEWAFQKPIRLPIHFTFRNYLESRKFWGTLSEDHFGQIIGCTDRAAIKCWGVPGAKVGDLPVPEFFYIFHQLHVGYYEFSAFELRGITILCYRH